MSINFINILKELRLFGFVLFAFLPLVSCTVQSASVEEEIGAEDVISVWDKVKTRTLGQSQDLVYDKNVDVAYQAGVKNPFYSTKLEGKKIFFKDSEDFILVENSGEIKFAKVDFENGKLSQIDLYKLFNFKALVTSAAISPDSKYLAIGGYARVIILDLENPSKYRTLSKLKGKVTSLDWHPVEDYLIVGEENGDIYGWRGVTTFKANTPSVGVVSITTDKSSIVDLYSGSISPIDALSFSTSGNSFLVWEREGVGHYWRRIKSSDMTKKKLAEAAEFFYADPSFHLKFEELGARIIDVWSAGNVYSIVSSTEADIRTTKLRGLKQLTVLKVQNQTPSQITGILPEGSEDPKLFVGFREQNFGVFCGKAVDTGDRKDINWSDLYFSEVFASPIEDMNIYGEYLWVDFNSGISRIFKVSSFGTCY